MEKTELEQNVAQSNKIVDRMSRNVEQLQWRIKNNYELPEQKVTTHDLIIHCETSPSVLADRPQPQLRYAVIVVLLRQLD